MQKLYCDRRVQRNGVNYYRVQGTKGWVFDVRPHKDQNKTRFMLLDESMVQKGLLAFRALGALSVRKKPTISDDDRTSRIVQQGDLIVVDVIRSSPYPYGNGPFLRLADGSGWLFEKKKNEVHMKEISIDVGNWTFRVKNEDAGIGLRTQPIDHGPWKTDTVFSSGTFIECDRRIVSPTGVSFYRVAKTDGWVFDLRNGSPMMELVRGSALPTSSQDGIGRITASQWTPDFVRGCAIACDGLEEISFNPSSRVISFRNADGVRINVYYTTRTIGTALEHPWQGKTQLFRRNCSDTELCTIMKSPRAHTDKGYQRKKARTNCDDNFASQVIVEGEEVARQALLDCDAEIQGLQRKRRQLLSSIRQHDLERRQEAAAAKRRRDTRLAENNKIEAEAQAILQKQEQQRRVEQQREQRRLSARTCNVCGRAFGDSSARDKHHQAVHVLECDYCDRTFSSSHALNQHRNAVGHW